MNKFESALAEHSGTPTAEGVTDACFAAGWLMALRAVRDSQGTWGTGGVVAELIAQAAEYTEPSDLTPAQEDYFRTLAKIDPSPEMGRVIAQAKASLAHHSADSLVFNTEDLSIPTDLDGNERPDWIATHPTETESE